MPTAFVTGATGFLGVNLVSALTARGWEVTALHRPRSNLSYLSRFKPALRVGTVEDLDSLVAAMPEGIDAVFHTAASVSWWRREAEAQHRTNVIGTRNVARAALTRHARRMIHTSSIAAYGEHTGELTERTPSNAGTSPIGYLRTKYLAELEVRSAIKEGLEAVILNPANIVGPYDLVNWSRSFRMVADGSLPGVPPGRGAFCHVKHVVEAHLSAVERGRVGESYILAGVNASYLEMFEIIGRLLGKRVPRKPIPALLLRIVSHLIELRSRLTGKAPDLTPDTVKVLCAQFTCSSAKAESELGYQSAQSLEGMLSDCHGWMVQEGLLPAR